MKPFPTRPLSELVIDTQYGTSTRANDERRGLPVLRMNNLTVDGRLDLDDLRWVELDQREREKLTLEPGDVLFNRTNSRELVGKTAVWKRDDPFTFAGYLIRVRVRLDVLLPDFLSAYLNSPAGKTVLFHVAKPSINMANISCTELLRLEIPVPPIEYQRRVIPILDKADAIRRKRKEALALTEDLLRSTFLEMFGDPVTNPKGWPSRSLSEVAEVNRGRFTPRPRNDPRFYGGAYPFIQTGDLRSADGYLRDWKQTLNDEGTTVSRGFPKGTIAITIAANIGQTAIVDFNFWCPDSVVAIEPKVSVPAEYLELLLRFWQPHLEAAAPETAQKNINLEVLRPLPIVLPPERDRQKMAQLYQQIYQLKGRQQLALTESEALFASLLDRAFRGELTAPPSRTAGQLPLF